MMNLHPFGGAPESQIVAFERRNALTLPTDYRDFLRNCNGGVLSRTACAVREAGEEVLVEALFGLGQARDFDLQGWLDEYRDEMPAGCLVIGCGTATTLFILGTAAEGAGIHCWDHAHVFDGSSLDTGNTYLIATSFAEFVDGLEVGPARE